MSSAALVLFSTQGCHLCEQVVDMLSQLGLSAQLIDIAYDDALFERYGVTIPVLKVAEHELNWRFTLEELTNWLEEYGINYHS